MDRLSLTDAQWAKMDPHCLGRSKHPGRSEDCRLFVEAVLWIVRTGGPWTDLPPRFGKAKSVYVRFRTWKKADIFKSLFATVADDPDMQYAMVDDTIVKLEHGKPAKKGLPATPATMKLVVPARFS